MADFARDDVRRQYEIAVEEYRFNVRLNWDRTKFYLVFNGAILAAGTGLQGIDLGMLGRVLLAAIFAFGIMLAVLGVLSMTRGHMYYRACVLKKTELETSLGFLDPLPGRHAPHGTLSITTTEGMKDVDAMLRDPEEWIKRSLRKGTITYVLRLAFIGLIGIHAVALIFAVSSMW